MSNINLGNSNAAQIMQTAKNIQLFMEAAVFAYQFDKHPEGVVATIILADGKNTKMIINSNRLEAIISARYMELRGELLNANVDADELAESVIDQLKLAEQKGS